MGQTGRARFFDTMPTPMTGGGQSVAARLPPAPPGRRYRLDVDALTGAAVVVVVNDDAPARTGDRDRAATTPATINAANRAFWDRRPGSGVKA